MFRLTKITSASRQAPPITHLTERKVSPISPASHVNLVSKPRRDYVIPPSPIRFPTHHSHSLVLQQLRLLPAIQMEMPRQYLSLLQKPRRTYSTAIVKDSKEKNNSGSTSHAKNT